MIRSREAGPEDWEARQRYWRRRLSRLRFGAEPLEAQVERYRRATWVLTAIPAAIAVFIITLFSLFGNLKVGAVLAAVLFLPIVATAWIDFARLNRGVQAYLRELQQFETRSPAEGQGSNGALSRSS
ncbi:MAG: hypothetical protein U0835_21340 [Isosphaeraceae bacterium]